MYSYYFCAHSTKTATENDVVLYSTYMENGCSDIIWIYMSHDNKQILGINHKNKIKEISFQRRLILLIQHFFEILMTVILLITYMIYFRYVVRSS